MLLHSVFLPRKYLALLFVVTMAFIGLNNGPAQALQGQCDPDPYCTADGQWGWPANREPPNNPDRPNPTGKDASANPNPPRDTSSAPSPPVPVGTAGPDYPDGTYKNHAQDPGVPNDGSIPNGAPDGRAASASKPSSPTPFQRAASIRQNTGNSATNAIRPAGPCFNHNLIDGITKLLPPGSHLYFGFNLSSKVPGADSQLLRTLLLSIINTANQYFGPPELATSLEGQTMVDQYPRAPLLNYKFSYYDTVSDAETAAASDPNKNKKFVIPVTDIYLPAKGTGPEDRITGATSTVLINRKTGEFIPKGLYINFTTFDWIRQLAAEKYTGNLLDLVSMRAIFLQYVVHLRHEIGHLLGLEHQVWDEPLDDDGSPMAYEGKARKVENANTNFKALFSPCDAVTFASHQ